MVENYDRVLKLQGDEVRFQQIFINVVRNAIRFTRHGSVLILVSFDDDFLTVQVADNGQGIAAEVLERVRS